MMVKYFRDRGGCHPRCGTNNFGELDASGFESLERYGIYPRHAA
jgi:hypothetical protein